MDENAVEIEQLQKSFGRVRAVDGLTLRGESVAILGPNGAGKATAIGMLLGLLTPDGGTVSVWCDDPRQAVVKGCIAACFRRAA
jgi:ABC-2 type transport system ATP-binding protein